MPELPEVESIRLQLENFLVGHKIESIKVINTKIFTGEAGKVVGSSFVSVSRLGKVISMNLDNDYSLVAHVKMTGQFLYKGPRLRPDSKLSSKVVGGLGGPHTHVIFNLDQDAKLYYNDVRRFGWIKVLTTSESLSTGLAGKMGPEPFLNLDKEYFKKNLLKTRRPIKVLLMDQEFIAGVGNIYANDALWLTKLNPKTPSNLVGDKADLLYESIHSVLKNGMKYGGSSENSFVTPDGGEGSYQRHTLVYGKNGTKCANCGTLIEKFMLGGRGTFYCPSCQK